MSPPAPAAREHGRLVVLVGASGSGKDTVLRWLAQHPGEAPGLHVARRSIDRPAEPSEEHEALDGAEFDALLHAGAFALHWRAHGRRYAVRHAELEPLTRGVHVLLNASRAHLARLRARHPDLLLVQLRAPDALLRARLLARGRESAAEIETRLARNARLQATLRGVDFDVVNDTTPQRAALALQRELSARLPPRR
jgi:phosphonate metabolism protein PhnN/1,5-bisphosphokinase (PRPP-forming)